MYMVESKGGAIVCMLLSLFFLGTWPAVMTLLERRGRLPQHTYLDYTITNLLAAVIIAFTFGQIGTDDPNFLSQLSQDNLPSVLFAMAGGVVLSIENLSTQYAWAFVGLSVVEVITSSITVVIGTTLNYFLDDIINKAEILFPGVGCFLIAVCLGSAVHSSNTADNQAKLKDFSNDHKNEGTSLSTLKEASEATNHPFHPPSWFIFVMTFTAHKRKKKDAPLLAPRMVKQSDQCGNKNVSLDECYKKKRPSFLCSNPFPKHVDQKNSTSFCPNPFPKHDDQKNSTSLHGPSLVDSLIRKMPVGRLPGCFAREFGETISDYVILRDPFHNEFEVQVVKKDGEVLLGDGWHSLKSVYDICFGAWVTITYVNSNLLIIKLFTRWGVEFRYPCYNPPLRHLLFRGGTHCKFGSSVVEACSAASTRPKSFVRSYVKELTLYDLHSGTLFLPWCGFGESAFAHVFSDLILVDNAGNQYMCVLKIDVDSSGELSFNLSGGWNDFCTTHAVVEGDRVKFSVAQYIASNVMYASVYARAGPVPTRCGVSPARHGEIIGPDLNQLAVANKRSLRRVSSAQNPARYEYSLTTRYGEFMQNFPILSEITVFKVTPTILI
ncbi:putative ureide permease A3 [Trifolium repens]|nr:putative ureide permease A3 [Trifolium repens]